MGADEKRVTLQNRCDALSSKDARNSRRLEHQSENKFFEDSDGQLHGAGIAD